RWNVLSPWAAATHHHSVDDELLLLSRLGRLQPRRDQFVSWSVRVLLAFALTRCLGGLPPAPSTAHPAAAMPAPPRAPPAWPPGPAWPPLHLLDEISRCPSDQKIAVYWRRLSLVERCSGQGKQTSNAKYACSSGEVRRRIERHWFLLVLEGLGYP